MNLSQHCVLVDDDETFLSLLAAFLEWLHPEFEVTRFTVGVDALRYIATHPVDLVVTDFRMPVTNGLELTEAIRADHRNLPIIMISGDDVAERALAHGANAFVPKRSVAVELASALQQSGFPVHG